MPGGVVSGVPPGQPAPPVCCGGVEPGGVLLPPALHQALDFLLLGALRSRLHVYLWRPAVPCTAALPLEAVHHTGALHLVTLTQSVTQGSPAEPLS